MHWFVLLPKRLDFGSLANGRLLEYQLLQLGGGRDEPDITAFTDLPTDPPVAVVLLEDVQEISDFKAENDNFLWMVEMWNKAILMNLKI